MRALLVVFIVAACGHPATAPKPPANAPGHAPWRGPEILAAVPADTPYLFAMIDPIAPGPRDRILRQTGVQLKAALQKAASGEGAIALVAAAMYSELDGADPASWPEALGLSRDARLVVYGLSVWPVVRLEIKDDARVRQVLTRIVKAGSADLQPRTVGRAMLYVIAENKISLVFGIVGHELVGAVVPSAVLDKALPRIIGTEAPARSLRDAQLVPSLFARHHFLSTTIGFLDLHRAFEAISGHGHGQFDDLDAQFTALIPATCQDDLMRIADALPRLAFGYYHLDDKGFDAAVVVETQHGLTDGLLKWSAPLPAIPASPRPLIALGAAVDIDAAFAWLKTSAAALRSHPFRCDALSKLNESVDALASKLDQPMPAELQGLRGFELVVDDASVLPPSGTGYVLVEGAHIGDEIRKLVAKVPQLATLQLSTGTPVELPVARMGLPPSFTSAHFAMRDTRAVITVGPQSAARASSLVSARDAHVPLMTMAFDVPRLRERFGAFMKDVDWDSISNIENALFDLDIASDGISLRIAGTWLAATDHLTVR